MDLTLFAPGATIDIIPIIMAFLAGCVGAAAGGVISFVMCGFAGLLCVTGLVGGAGAGLLSIAFGFVWHPAFTFMTGALAAAYAYKRGYMPSGKDIATPLIALKKPDVIFAGGVFGIIGYIVLTLLTSASYLGIAVDGGAITIVVVSILTKLVFDKGNLFGTGKVPAEVKAKGGRFSTHHDSCWVPHMRTGWEKIMYCLAWGGTAIACTMVCFNAGGGDIAALGYSPAYACFFLAACYLGFAMSGAPIAASHHYALPAGYAVCGALMCGVTDPFLIILWGVSMSMVSAFAGDFLADCYTNYGEVFIDPPASGIFVSSLIIMTILVPTGIMNSYVIPIIVIALALCVAIFQSMNKKKFAAN